jgi:hypothetical protein
MERWDSYATRRVDVSPEIEKNIDDWANGANLTPIERIERAGYGGQMMADARLLAMRELMKMEMPDRWSDLLNQPLQDNAVLNPPTFLASVPGLTRSYYRRLAEVQYNADNDVNRILDNEGAECLYMLVMLGTGDGEARTMFSTTEIGDVDGDGAPEFIDGWGRPIQWIRWPAGFLQQSVLMTGDADADHDPFDAFRRDSTSILPTTRPRPNEYPNSFLGNAVEAMRARNQLAPTAITTNPPRFLAASRLVPLVYSAGADGRFDLITGRGGSEAEADEEAESVMGVDPYAENNEQLQMGQPNPANYGWRDNIHNHLNEY